jgi:polar amino acid transport system permease protein
LSEVTRTGPDTAPSPARPEAIRAVPVRHPGRWVTGAVLLVLFLQFVHMLATNKFLGWDKVGHWFFWKTVRDGVLTTLELMVLGMAIGIAGGILLAVMRMSKNPLARWTSWLYIWFFRGTPVLVQFFFWFNLSLLVGRQVTLGVPFGPALLHLDTNKLITAFTAAVIALGLNEAAYMAEIVRAGILSVDEGQNEAASALGMRRAKIMTRIVLPQAMRVIVPPTGNETISMLKTTSLAYSIGTAELFGVGEGIGSYHAEVMPLLVTVSLWYLGMTTILSVGQFYLERYYARGSSRNLPPTPLKKILTMNLLWRRRTYTAARTPPAAGRTGGEDA